MVAGAQLLKPHPQQRGLGILNLLEHLGHDRRPCGTRDDVQGIDGLFHAGSPSSCANARTCSFVIPNSASGERIPRSRPASQPGRSLAAASEALLPSMTMA